MTSERDETDRVTFPVSIPRSVALSLLYTGKTVRGLAHAQFDRDDLEAALAPSVAAQPQQPAQGYATTAAPAGAAPERCECCGKPEKE